MTKKKARNMTTEGMAKRLFHPKMIEHARRAVREAEKKAEPKGRKKKASTKD